MARPGLILVVDDDADVTAALAAVLEVHGYGTVTARDGLEALLQLQAGLRPSLIVLDWMMPRLDGRGFLERIAADRQLASIPVIVYSALGSRIRANDVAETISKGEDPEVLLSAVARYAKAA